MGWPSELPLDARASTARGLLDEREHLEHREVHRDDDDPDDDADCDHHQRLDDRREGRDRGVDLVFIEVGDLPEHLLEARGLRIRRDESGKLAADASLFEIVADYERRKIIESLEASDWSQTSAAESLRIPLSTLNQKIKRLNIEIRKKSAG